jgi:hypothetical protein
MTSASAVNNSNASKMTVEEAGREMATKVVENSAHARMKKAFAKATNMREILEPKKC